MTCPRCHLTPVEIPHEFCPRCWRLITIAQSQYARCIIDRALLDHVWSGEIDDAIAAKHPWSAAS